MAGEADYRLWTPRDLAAYLGYQESTVSRLVSTAPAKLPPRVAALHRPRWDPDTVRRWVSQQSAPTQRQGRPRLTRV